MVEIYFMYQKMNDYTCQHAFFSVENDIHISPKKIVINFYLLLHLETRLC